MFYSVQENARHSHRAPSVLRPKLDWNDPEVDQEEANVILWGTRPVPIEEWSQRIWPMGTDWNTGTFILDWI